MRCKSLASLTSPLQATYQYALGLLKHLPLHCLPSNRRSVDAHNVSATANMHGVSGDVQSADVLSKKMQLPQIYVSPSVCTSGVFPPREMTTIRLHETDTRVYRSCAALGQVNLNRKTNNESEDII